MDWSAALAVALSPGVSIHVKACSFSSFQAHTSSALRQHPSLALATRQLEHSLDQAALLLSAPSPLLCILRRCALHSPLIRTLEKAV